MSFAKSGAQREDKEAARAMVNVAKGSVNEVNALLEDQYLVAPCGGEITEIYPHVSELVATLSAPIMSLQKDDHWVVFNVRETLLKDIKLGSTLKVKIPALDIETDVKVFYIKDLGTYANWQYHQIHGRLRCPHFPGEGASAEEDRESTSGHVGDSHAIIPCNSAIISENHPINIATI